MHRRLHIHAGLPKTGTSALQRFLALNRAKLAERGIGLAQTGWDAGRGNHHQLMFDLGGLRGTARRAAARDLGQETGTLLVSSEFAYLMIRYAFGGRGMRALTDQGIEPVFHLFIRPQTDFAVSAHPEYLRNILIAQPFDRFMARNFMPFAGDYAGVVARLQGLSPAKVRVLPYARAAASGGPWWDLLDSVGHPVAPEEQGGFKDPGRTNPSLGPVATAALLSTLAKHQPQRWQARLHQREKILATTRAFPEETRAYNPLSVDQRRKIWEACRPANDTFAQVHWQKSWDAVFAEEAASAPPPSTFDPLTSSDLSEKALFAEMERGLYETFHAAEARLRNPRRKFRLRRLVGRPVDWAADRALRWIATGRL